MESAPRSPTVRVLVVDDFPDMTESTAIMLGLWGYEARTANGGKAALRLAEEWIPDAVLLDIAMPCMTGWEVVKQLKQMPGLERTLLVAVTGHARAMDFQRSFEAGFDCHVVKPFAPGELHKLLKSRLENAPAELAGA
jgi:CheY-like chemotaxis protein